MPQQNQMVNDHFEILENFYITIRMYLNGVLGLEEFRKWEEFVNKKIIKIIIRNSG